MNPGDPNHPAGQQPGAGPAGPPSGAFPGGSDPTSFVGANVPGTPQGPASGQIPAQGAWGNPYDPQHNPNQPYGPNAPYGAWGQPPMAPGPRPDISLLLALASVVAGLVTYFMGFVSWISVASGVEDEADKWSEDLANGDRGVPGFFSYEIVLNPGKFLILLGAVAVATTLVLVPKYRKALPFLAVIATAGWLALFAAALVVPPVVELGAGAIVALIFGFLQVALLLGAAFLFGLKKDDPKPA